MDKTTATNLKVLVGGLAALSLYAGSSAPRFTGKFLDGVYCKVARDCAAPRTIPVKDVRPAATTNSIVLQFNKAVELYQTIAAAPENAQFMLAPSTEFPFDVMNPEQSLDDFTQFVVWQQHPLRFDQAVFDRLQRVLDDVDSVRNDLRMAKARGQYIVPEAKP